MPTYSMGDAIREMRTRLGCTQEELSYGICTPGTLSRIENGREIVSKQVFEAICQRLPGIHHVWVSCDTKREMQRSKLCKLILLYLEQRDLQKAQKAIVEYHTLKAEANPFCQQFALYTQAIYAAISGKEKADMSNYQEDLKKNQEILEKLQQAMEITMPDYKERMQTPKKILFTYDELYILINMAIQYAKLGEAENAFRILYYLKEYLKTRPSDMTESVKVYLMLLGSLAWLQENQGDFQEAVKQCDAGIEICNVTGKYTLLPQLLCLKARCFTASENLENARKCRQQAKAILDITGKYRGYGSFEEFYKAKEPIYVIY